MTTGRKDDQEKPRWDLLPLATVGEVVRVLTIGARRYGDWNWKRVARWRGRYFAASLRHLAAWKLGERLDPDDGLPHLAHAIACLLILSERERMAEGRRTPSSP